MAYKGDDLDLQLPGGRDQRLDGAEPGNGPIVVDETLLACCNSAFEAADFHGSGEVRPEHLLHALTRIPGAAAVLAELGIDAAQLRRETAVAIAAEMPAGPVDEQGPPRTSAGVADALRRAAVQADRRRAPAAVQDLIRALLDGGAESPAAALLVRAAADPQRLERWRRETLADASAASPGAAPEHVATAAAQAMLQRLDVFEASFAALRAEVSADRKALADLLRAVQGELHTLRSAAGDPMPADTPRAFDAAPGAAPDVASGATQGALDTRLGALSGAVAALTERLASDNPEDMQARVEAFEGRIAAQARDVAHALSTTLTGRLDQADGSLQRLQDDVERHGNAVNERQIALEASVRAQLQGAEEARKAYERDLAEVYEALVKLGTNQQTLGDNLSTWRLENSGDIGIISNRLQQLEQTAMGMLSHLDGELQTLRQESLEDGAPRAKGFKRWLYGTRSIFANSWRDEAASIRQSIAPPRKDEKS